MPSQYDPNRHHRRSIRLKGYDYTTAGAYFVTLCVEGRQDLLGDIVDGNLQLNEYGRIVETSWEWLGQQYPYVDLDEWVVMPNHLHGIVVICDDRRGDSRKGDSRIASTKRKPLGRLVGAFKTVSTKQINLVRGTPAATIWQRNYYEHIIRNEGELARIRKYIVENPLKWDLVQENPGYTLGDTVAESVASQ
jgi:REP element-mobilizing transposase RayT